jgi:hypothetical protein
MASLPVRDPVGDHVLTPQNAALAVIDYQPCQFAGVRSMDHDLLLENQSRSPGVPLLQSIALKPERLTHRAAHWSSCLRQLRGSL